VAIDPRVPKKRTRTASPAVNAGLLGAQLRERIRFLACVAKICGSTPASRRAMR
jgi:hypothetical protein